MDVSDRDQPAAVDSAIAFGPYYLDFSAQTFSRNGEHVKLGKRALAILCILLERPGRLVSKSELFERVWPGSSVDEANLRMQVAALRKALGEHASDIVSVTALGYRFIGEPTDSSSDEPPSRPFRFEAPAAAEEPLGRERYISSISDNLGSHRLVSIVGPGGIGKTTLALAVAKELGGFYRDGVSFVDLGLLTDARSVPAAVAASLHQPVGPGDLLVEILGYLRTRNLLIILDCCDRVVGDVAILAEQVLQAAPNVHIIATSREALRAQGELVEQIEALETPLWTNALTAADAMSFSAIQLFARSARSGSGGFQVVDGNAGLVAEICRRLDGIPLAIEFAASMTTVLGLDAVRDGLDQRFAILTLGRRTALPRHRTLEATVAWSYDLLSDNERTVLRRLANFVGWFTMDAAVRVASGDLIGEAEARQITISLAGKSQLSVNWQSSPARYRLAETTRVFAHQQAAPLGEREQAARTHARYHLALLEGIDWEAYDARTERGVMVGHRDEIRVALDWAYGQGGDNDLAVQLTLAAERLWLELSLFGECIQRMTQALAILDDALASRILKMRALTGIGTAKLYAFTRQTGPLEFEEAFQLADAENDHAHKLRTMWGLCHYHLLTRVPSKPLVYADRFRAIASEQPGSPEVCIGDHLAGYAYYCDGFLRQARHHFEKFLAEYTSPPRHHAILMGYAKRISGEAGLSWCLLFQGYPEKALAHAENTIVEARKLNHGPTTFFALGLTACCIALYSWDTAATDRHLAALDALEIEYEHWRPVILAYRGMQARQRGDPGSACKLIEQALTKGPLGAGAQHPLFLVELADARRLCGDYAGARQATDLADDCRHGTHEIVTQSNVLRARGQIAIDQGGEANIRDAEALLVEAIMLSREQDAALLELNAAVPLSKILSSQGRVSEARGVLEAAIARTAEGHHLPPAKSAIDALQALSPERLA